MKKLLVPLTFSILILILAACNALQTTGGNPSAAQAAALPPAAEKAAADSAAGEMTVADAAANGEYPASPEAVVQAFLTAYGLAPDQMAVYLTPGLQGTLPAGGPVELVKLNGMLEGFVIDSAAVDPVQGAAIVTAGVRSGGVDSSRTFHLVLENGRWSIQGIESLS